MRTALPGRVAQLAIVVAVAAVAGCDITVGVGDRYLEREKKDYQVSGTPEISLMTFDGSIEIRAWDRAEVSVEIEKRGGSRDAVQRIEVNATQSGNRITIDVKDADRGRAHIGFSTSRSARLIASVPRQANVEARSGDGSISIEGVSGKVNVNTGDGSIRMTEVSGELRVHSGDGSLRLDRLSGRLDADTGDGSIVVSGKLEGVRLRTGDGTVRVRAEDGSSVADGWDIDTGDGSIAVDLPDSFDADLDAHTGDGRVAVTNLSVKGDVSRASVRGQLGAGGRTLRVTSGDGNIVISRS